MVLAGLLISDEESSCTLDNKTGVNKKINHTRSKDKDERHLGDAWLTADCCIWYSGIVPFVPKQDVASPDYLTETSVWFATDVRSCGTPADAAIVRLLSTVEEKSNSRQEGAGARWAFRDLICSESGVGLPEVQGTRQVNWTGVWIGVLYKDGDRYREAALVVSCKTQWDCG